ncbi:MAG: hypothetical protein ACI9G1_000121 [Pirellulaceae bacterium]
MTRLILIVDLVAISHLLRGNSRKLANIGILQVAVSQEMVTTWLKTVGETEKVLQGKKLIPFWRGANKDRGVNLRRVFTEPRTIDPILWVQGTAATPYLEEGTITDFANPRTLGQINSTFGGANFFGFAFWFN